MEASPQLFAHVAVELAAELPQQGQGFVHAGAGDGMADDAGSQHAGVSRSEPGADVELGAGDEGAAVGGKGHFKGVVEGVEVGFDGGSTVHSGFPLPPSSLCDLRTNVHNVNGLTGFFGPTVM